MAGYDHQAVEAKWRARWEKDRTFATRADRTRPKYYVLDMFPYPSGDGLHVGHPKGYVATDVVARARRMMGFNVLRVMGWDSFGLPAERQAVKEGRHPREITERNIARFKSQLSNLGLSYDWDYELATSDERYYRWTQWIFLKLYERGLAYQAEVPVNWCPALGTVLSNEEVKDGKYVETGDPVERRMMRQWMLRITAYADRLVDDLDSLDWPAGIIQMQKDWIGRSEGAQVKFEIDRPSGTNPAGDGGGSFEIFTTRPDTLFGCTYVVLAPEHALVDRITTAAQKAAVAAYREEVGKQSDRDRTAQAADAPKTGVFTGAFAINPVNGEKVPVWIADYVLAGYGTGAVFACPAHDERDHAFATTFGLPIVEVVKGGDVSKAAYVGDGPHVNSRFLDGLDVAAAKREIVRWLEDRQVGKGTIQYRLRDWLFSRQRYWGEPFPLVELEDGTIEPVPEDQLPVLLPQLDEYRPTEDGRPPLARAGDWVATEWKGRPAKRETNTMPQWAGSCWYYLRFTSPGCDTAAFDPEAERYWMPVDLYVGGAEHAVLHLLYARFWHKVLYDLGLVHTKEPFQRLVNQGMVHATSYNDSPDGRGKFYYPYEVEARDDGFVAKANGKPLFTKVMKMSKSRYNVTNPDDICRDFGADALRLYELFMGPLEDGALWEDAGVAGTRRFLDKVWRMFGELPRDPSFADKDVERALHGAIKKVTEAVQSLRFNTAVSDLMIFANEVSRAGKVNPDWLDRFVRILAPFAPHLAEELWEGLGHAETIAFAEWPSYDEAKLARDTITIAVQVNGKLRAQIEVPADAAKDAILAEAKSAAAKHLEGVALKREVYVPGRLVNLVVGG
jgi:leucyl-tRNA synthetase